MTTIWLIIDIFAIVVGFITLFVAGFWYGAITLSLGIYMTAKQLKLL